MRLILSLLLAIHGALHLLGFANWWPLARIRGLHDPALAVLVNPAANSRRFALYWLLAACLLLAGALLYTQNHRNWWQAAFAGLVLSQILISFVWRDAKFGTIANLLVLVLVVAAAADAHFKRQFERQAAVLLADAAPGPGQPVQIRELEALPLPVRRWLGRSEVVGKAHVRTLRLRQAGQLRTSPTGPWLPAEAEQYFSTATPGFVWSVDARLFGVLPIVGRDEYRAGKGRMLIKAAALLTVADAAGPKIDSGAMLRFLGEIVWFPSAALSPHIQWTKIDDRSAQATFSDHQSSVSARFEFDAQGRVARILASRYLGGDADAVLTPWVVSCSAWGRFAGVEVPVEGDVAWQLPDVNFSYYRWRILDVEYDPRLKK